MNSSEGSESSLPEQADERVSVHLPVLLEETLGVLGLEPGLTVVDGTIGAGGHAAAAAKAIIPGGMLMGLDRDAAILARARERLFDGGVDAQARVGVQFYQLPFSEMRTALDSAGLSSCDRVLLDLGVSSLQLDTPERGFSFMHDGALDMRMDSRQALTAERWLSRVNEQALVAALSEFGQERFSKRIARGIIAARERGRMSRTSHLVDAVMDAVPAASRRGRIHPATRTFQAIRIVVNDELGELKRGLEAALDCLSPGGRLAVISFHSLEDRITKRFLREQMELPFRKPVQSGEKERECNRRSRSAKLRCGIKRVA